MGEPRIVSLIASATEIVSALGMEHRLVGRSHECDFPPGVLSLPVCSSSKVDAAASSRDIGRQVREIVGEALSVYRVDGRLLDELAPTVIVTQTQCEVCAVSLRDVEEAVCEVVRSQPGSFPWRPWRSATCSMTLKTWPGRSGFPIGAGSWWQS